MPEGVYYSASLEVRDALEIRRDSFSQVVGLADVDYPGGRVAHDVNAGGVR